MSWEEVSIAVLLGMTLRAKPSNAQSNAQSNTQSHAQSHAQSNAQSSDGGPDAASIQQLQHYRKRLEDQLRLMQRRRAEEMARGTAYIRLMGSEIAALEHAREADAARFARELSELRDENALLTAAAMRMHEQWSGDAVQLESLRAELRTMDAESSAARSEAHGMLIHGADLAEQRYRRSERRRTVDVRLLAAELAQQEVSGGELLVTQQTQHLRLHADARCAARELRLMEVEAQTAAQRAIDAEAAARREHAESDSVRAQDLQELGQVLSAQSGALEEVVDALRTWEACDAAERAHILLSSDRLEAASRELEEICLHQSFLLPSEIAALLPSSPPRPTPRLARSRSFTSSGLGWSRADSPHSAGPRARALSMRSIDSPSVSNRSRANSSTSMQLTPGRSPAAPSKSPAVRTLSISGSACNSAPAPAHGHGCSSPMHPAHRVSGGNGHSDNGHYDGSSTANGNGVGGGGDGGSAGGGGGSSSSQAKPSGVKSSSCMMSSWATAPDAHASHAHASADEVFVRRERELEWLEWAASPRSTPIGVGGGSEPPMLHVLPMPPAQELTVPHTPSTGAVSSSFMHGINGTGPICAVEYARPPYALTTSATDVPGADVDGQKVAAHAAAARAISAAADLIAWQRSAGLEVPATEDEGYPHYGGGHASAAALAATVSRSMRTGERLVSAPMQLHRCAGPSRVSSEQLVGAAALVAARSWSTQSELPSSSGPTSTGGRASADEDGGGGSRDGTPRPLVPPTIVTPVAWSPGAFPMGMPVSSLLSSRD